MRRCSSTSDVDTNGARPNTMKYSVVPSAHMSDANVAPAREEPSTRQFSGAMKIGVPTIIRMPTSLADSNESLFPSASLVDLPPPPRMLPLSTTCVAVPKSESFTVPSPPTRRLSGLMSRCTMFWECMYCTPSITSANMRPTVFSSSGVAPSAFALLRTEPLGRNSSTISTFRFLASSCASYSCTMFSCLNFRRISTSRSSDVFPIESLLSVPTVLDACATPMFLNGIEACCFRIMLFESAFTAATQFRDSTNAR
mmetsp:Transcript_3194/g.6925  ORF Transcript_3194/g.6925 Transcript_3194/m.6925 type:complete len:255 (-) Transcript_3194:51-815(-)